MACELCDHLETPAWRLVWRDERLRVVRVADAPDFPGFYRVIWNAHVAELSDLPEADRAHLMQVLVVVERALRDALAPDKINLAALGNMVPHLHWHLIARHAGDSHFPQPIWGSRQRDGDTGWLARCRAALPALDTEIARRLSA